MRPPKNIRKYSRNKALHVSREDSFFIQPKSEIKVKYLLASP